MDIVITLPQDLWKKIVSGEKTIELRKNFPKDFDVKTDRVYVIWKGTTHIAGYFMVSSFEVISAQIICEFNHIVNAISVPKQWIMNYVRDGSYVYLWNIRDVVQFGQPIDRRYYWKMETNPQSFIYLR